MSYFISVDGSRKEGPFSYEEIQKKLSADEIDENTLIWRKGMEDWKPIVKAEEFESLFEALPPPLLKTEQSIRKEEKDDSEAEGLDSPFFPSSFATKNWLTILLTVAFLVLAIVENFPPLTSFVETAENNRVYLIKNPDCFGFWPFVEFTTENAVNARLEKNKSEAITATRELNTAANELYEYLHRRGLYTKSFEEFQSQFATSGARRQLYDKLFRDTLYVKSFDDFQSLFDKFHSTALFNRAELTKTATKQETSTKRVFNGFLAGWSSLEWLVYFGFLWLGVFKRKWRISSLIVASLFVIVSWIGWYLYQWYMGALLTEGLGYEIVFIGMVSWRQSVIAGLFGGICSIAVTYALAVVLMRIFKRSRNFKSGVFLVICALIAFLMLSGMSHLDDVIDKPRGELLENMEGLRSKIESALQLEANTNPPQ